MHWSLGLTNLTSDKSNPQEMKAMARFFKMFYQCVDVGSRFAIIVLEYVQYQLINYTYGIGICTGVMTIALILLLREERSYRCLDKAIIVDGSRSRNKYKSNDWTHIIITQVEDEKEVIKLIPIWSTCILFWTVYNQMDTFTMEQAAVMNFKHSIMTIPTSSLSVFLYFSNFLFTSLYEHAYVHIAKKKWSKRTHKPSKKTGIRLVFSVVDMGVAALCEKRRREMAWHHGAKMSALWLVPQLFLVGAGEAFSYGQLEFFITEAPEDGIYRHRNISRYPGYGLFSE
ncbi:putative ABC-type nitrate transporter [Helianthus anomalus]